MATRRIQSESFRGLGKALPPNLFIYDGHCVLSCKFANWALERNFGYFDVSLLKPNEFWFCTRQSLEGRRVLSYLKDLEKIDTPILVEKVRREEKYSKSKALADDQAASSHPVFGATTEKNPNAMGHVVEYDLEISIKSHAMLRVMLKLDRIWWGVLAYCIYHLVPRIILDFLFDILWPRRFTKFGRKTSHSEPEPPLCDHPNADFLTRQWKLPR